MARDNINSSERIQPTHLSGQHDERHTDHDHHVELRRPNVGHKVTVANRREGHHHIVGALEQVQVAMAGALKVLDAAHAVSSPRVFRKGWNV